MAKFSANLSKRRKLPQTPQEAMAEAKRFYENAKQTLKQVLIEHGIYKDTKPVREACAIGYLSVNFAIDSYLLRRGKIPSELPTSFNEYTKEIKKIPHNGKLMDSFIAVYQNLHILGYYRGGIETEMIKSGFKHAKSIIDAFAKLSTPSRLQAVGQANQ